MSTNLHAFSHDEHRFPWSAAPAAGSLTYEPHFGLREKPFSLSADPRFLYKSPLHAPAFDQLLAGIKRREGLIVLTGEIGTGKTTLCRAVLEHLDRRTFSTFVPDPFVSREDLLKMLLVDFGVMSIDDLKAGRLRDASRAELSYPLYEFLNSLVPLQAFAVLIIDEAQNLPLPLLEEIRILSDLEGREKLLQVVLIGQPELRSNLKLPQMRQVDQRISVRCELEPLGRADVDGYVSWRLNVAAGGTCDAVRFSSDALDAVYRASGGTPRLINRICDRALHEACRHRVKSIDVRIVASALAHLGMHQPEPASTVARSRDGQRRLATLALTGVALCGATVAASSWYRLRPKASANAELSLPNVPAQPVMRKAPAFVATSAEAAVRLVEDVAPSARAAKYIVQVASFEDEERARQLVAQLAAAGFRAFQSAFPLDGDRWWQVSVGPYPTLADAQPDLHKIQRLPGYEDATVRTPARP